ncbi:DUF2203 domain-containing protein [Silvibacterium acidisoli]|uniref:DUF2203 domain-containing protein n=1 Tax=Acidobacteriaceae bacterium ZG23-2 TaxID=2883246 RepID=UPI00406C691A
MDDFETRTFTLDEAQSLLPVLESLIKRAVDAKRAVEVIEGRLQELARKIFLSGGYFVDVTTVARDRTALNTHVQAAKDSVAEIDAIGVQVKDLDSGLLDFPCFLDGEIVLLCWKLGETRITHWHTIDAGFRGRQPIDERFHVRRSGKSDTELPN